MAAEVKAKATLDSSGFRTGLDRMKGAVGGMTGMAEKLQGALASAFGIYTIKRFVGAILSASAAFEDLTVQFKVLLGSQQKAVAHMNELTEFSAVTPYQIEQIADASQQLIVFTEGAHGGVEALRLFGDAAAATGNNDLAGLTYWAGRFYAALKSGEPIERTINALSRLKVVAPSTRIEINKMQEAGASGAEIWAKFTEDLKRFEGGMEELSRTVKGKTSTMKDNWRIALAEMGDAMQPFTIKVLSDLTLVARGFERFTKGLRLGFARMGAASAGDDWAQAWETAYQSVVESSDGLIHDFLKNVGDMDEGANDASGEIKDLTFTIKRLWEEGPVQDKMVENWRAWGEEVKNVSDAIDGMDFTDLEKAGAFFGGKGTSRAIKEMVAAGRKRMLEGEWQDDDINTKVGSVSGNIPIAGPSAPITSGRIMMSPGAIADMNRALAKGLDRLAELNSTQSTLLSKIVDNTADGGGLG